MQNKETDKMLLIMIISIIAMVCIVAMTIVFLSQNSGSERGQSNLEPVYVNAETGEILDAKGNQVGDVIRRGIY